MQSGCLWVGVKPVKALLKQLQNKGDSFHVEISQKIFL